jgi:hypothetical protein
LNLSAIARVDERTHRAIPRAIQKQTSSRIIFTRKLAQVLTWLRTGRREVLPLHSRFTQRAEDILTKRLTAFAQRFGLDHQPVEHSCTLMKNADEEFHARKAPLLNTISEEALQIARSNHWPAVVIEMSGAGMAAGGWRGNVHCCLKNPEDASAIDEPSARLLDAAQSLHSLFAEVGTPFRSVTIDWVDEAGDGKVRRRCRYEYH